MSVAKRVTRVLGRAFLFAYRWEVEEKLPDVPRAVVVAAPHTSNWDLPLAIATAWALGFDYRWMGKHTLFRFPFGPLMRALGGIPVDRRANHNAVAAAIELLEKNETLMLLIQPEGTRGRAKRWKTGFYHTAVGADVPIVLGFLDFGRRRSGLGPVLRPTGDIDADFVAIREFYKDIVPKFPELYGEIRIREEE